MEEPTMMLCPYCGQYHNANNASELEQCPLNPSNLSHTLLNAGMQLDEQTRATIDQDGRLSLWQVSEPEPRILELSAQSAYELLTWLYDNHLDTLRQIARKQQDQDA